MVKLFRRCDMFRGETSWRNPDLLVEYVDGKIEIIEIKPEEMLKDEAVRTQIRESKIFADNNGYGYKIWSEANSGLKGEKEIINWAKEYLKINYNDTKFAEYQKINRQRTSKKHYDEKIKTNIIPIDCKYCNKIHTVLRKTYEAAIKNKGSWICEAEAGYIGGSSPKPTLRKVNPHALDGKKQCMGKCGLVLLFECFSPDSSRRDGYCDKCRKCRRKKNEEL
jgi:hypothetical protein